MNFIESGHNKYESEVNSMQAKDIKYTIEDFYALPEGTRAELIDGVIYDMAPSPSTEHQEISGELFVAIHSYIAKNKGQCKVFSAPYDIQLSDNTVVIPDISVICDRNKITNKRCVGAPDWIIEIVSTNAVSDYIIKLHLYQSYGVREYWIVDPKNQSVTVYHFGEDFNTEKYNFSETIPVWIYKDNPTPLEINISELI